MASKVNKNMEPVMRLLGISKTQEQNKLKEEKVLPLLKEFTKKKPDGEDPLADAMKALNKAVDALNVEIENVNKIYKGLVGGGTYNSRAFSTYGHFQTPIANTNKWNYSYAGKTYTLTKEQYDQIVKIDNDIYNQLDIKYLTLEAKIILEGDFKEIAKILKDNGILVDDNIK